MQHFFVPPSQVEDGEIQIYGSDVNHMKNVLRMRPGEEVMVSDGNNRMYRCRILDYPGESARLEILEEHPADTSCLPGSIFFRGFPNRKRWS